MGPMPASAEEMRKAEEESIRRSFAERQEADDERAREAANAHKAHRESWMTELPERHRKNFGLGNRTFRQQYAVVDDGSSWTATPNADGTASKQAPHHDAAGSSGHEGMGPTKTRAELEREREVAAKLKAFNDARRSESLLDMHRRKDKDKAGKKPEDEDPSTIIMPSGRTRFDRERDVVSQHVSTSAKQKMIKHASGFHSKFTTGSFQ